MKTVLVMRHAKSSWDNAFLSDFERPLNSRGRRDAPRMGQLLRDEELVPDVILSSPAVRALTTAKEVALACGYDVEIRLDYDLYHADPETMIEALQILDDGCERVLLVAHNPGLAELVEAWSAASERMPTAAIAHFQLMAETWNDVSLDSDAELINVWYPRVLG